MALRSDFIFPKASQNIILAFVKKKVSNGVFEFAVYETEVKFFFNIKGRNKTEGSKIKKKNYSKTKVFEVDLYKYETFFL